MERKRRKEEKALTTSILWKPAASDRFSIGRNGVKVDHIINHTSTTTWDGTIATFQGGERLVSAHFIVDWANDRIAQCVKVEDTSWGCGNWNMNLRCVNIEHVDNGDWNGIRPDALYARSVWLHKKLRDEHGIIISRQFVRRHSEVIATECPDTLDVDRIVREINGGTQDVDEAGVLALIEKQYALTNTLSAIKKRLSIDAHHTHTGTTGEPVEKPAMLAAMEPSKSTPAKEDVLKGHGKGE